MQIMMYMFLRRNRQVDVPYIYRSLSYLLHCASPRSSTVPPSTPSQCTKGPRESTTSTIYSRNHSITATKTTSTSVSVYCVTASPSVYFFPEGTDLSSRNIERSNTCELYLTLLNFT